MRLIVVPKQKCKILALCSIAILVFHFCIRYLASEDIEKTDLTMLAGHCIALDAGHGGIDSGASANGVVEKEITLAITMKLADLLQRYGADIVFTRESDLDYYTKGKGGKRNDLLKRIALIENSEAEIFISIHCNAFHVKSLSGAQVFYNPKYGESKILAETLQQVLKEFPVGNKRQVKKDLRIFLLNDMDMPGVLIETGYVTNQQEAALLVTDNYQRKLVEKIACALAYHFSQKVAR